LVLVLSYGEREEGIYLGPKQSRKSAAYLSFPQVERKERKTGRSSTTLLPLSYAQKKGKGKIGDVTQLLYSHKPPVPPYFRE